MTVAQIIEHEIGICPITLKNLHTLTSSKVCIKIIYFSQEMTLYLWQIICHCFHIIARLTFVEIYRFLGMHIFIMLMKLH
jgi:hypothetical protein